jgi:hypothetical protein
MHFEESWGVLIIELLNILELRILTYYSKSDLLILNLGDGTIGL